MAITVVVDSEVGVVAASPAGVDAPMTAVVAPVAAVVGEAVAE